MEGKFLKLNPIPMKKHIIKLSFLALLSSEALAQDSTIIVASNPAPNRYFEIGARFMPTFSSFNAKNSSGNTVTGEATFGFGVGGFVAVNFKKHVGIQAEVIYSSISQKYKENDLERKVDLSYINIPLLLSLNTDKSRMFNLNLVVGPQIGLSQGSKLSTTGTADSSSTLAVLSVKKGDLGFAYGAGADFALNEKRNLRFGLGFRGVFGLLDISDDSKSTDNSSFYLLAKTHVETYSLHFGFSYLF